MIPQSLAVSCESFVAIVVTILLQSYEGLTSVVIKWQRNVTTQATQNHTCPAVAGCSLLLVCMSLTIIGRPGNSIFICRV